LRQGLVVQQVYFFFAQKRDQAAGSEYLAEMLLLGQYQPTDACCNISACFTGINIAAFFLANFLEGTQYGHAHTVKLIQVG
jgi:hypothetical protein